MKFGKEFTSQMVQEWQEAYMDYNFLKTVLKDIWRFKQKKKNNNNFASSTPRGGVGGALRRKVSLHRGFSGLTTSRYRNSPASGRRDIEEPILVGAVQREGSEEHYQTMFFMSGDEGGEHELVFFRKLDDEFNKVVKFYRKKVEEVVEEAYEMTRQMDVLIALRIKVKNPALKPEETEVVKPSKTPARPSMDTIREVEMSREGQSEEGEEEEGKGEERRGNETREISSSQRNDNERRMEKCRPDPLEIPDHVKINITPETLMSTLRGILMSSTANLSFSKEELRKSEELMKKAFVEFYQKLRLLKSYCFMNQLAFSKIMKKYDKIASRNASKAYLEMVDKSYLGSSDEVTRLMERVEAVFTKHFAQGNRGKGMNILRPKTKRERHRVTFFLGFLSGCSLALIVTIYVLIQTRNIIKSEGRGRYMDNIFPLYSLFGFIVLHMLVFSGNIYFWRRYRVNYPFIFGLKEGTELGYRQVLLLSAALSVVSLAAVISNLDMDMDRKTNHFETLPELFPLGLVIVTLPDFFFADQLTSQVQALRSLEFYVCYYVWGDFRKRENKCLDSPVYQAFYIVVAIIPYWLRLLQCLRRLLDDRDSIHSINGLKYFSIIIAVAMRTLYEQKKGTIFLILAAATSGIATIGATYWDLVIDWGLLQRNSKNPWLRDKLIIPNKSVYFVAMARECNKNEFLDSTVLGFREVPFLHRKALIAIVACLEIIRRGIWNFFRLENEHLNNVGKYRAFKSVPLPFNYEEKDT
ncbi:Phosphate transporter PHO1-3-like protein [Morus notabilis]|uniref:Phosphate transporter PHO1-3-like protein n=1 Tax=Morus notabilis TaxID=981085 RepID=W9R0H6_9ROSA|nr:Phosphate transporter PHO1-3-like protein [Morus notabilis]